MGKIHIKRFSTGSIWTAVILVILFVLLSIYGTRNFQMLEDSTDQYLTCEKAALKLQKGSDILTEQVRLYVMTGQRKYLDGYFEEANVTKHRETAIADLKGSFDSALILLNLEAALKDSRELMEQEYYAMRLAAAGFGASQKSLPEEVKAVTLTEEDQALSSEEKLTKARSLVSDDAYQTSKEKISGKVERCMKELAETTKNQQSKASSKFKNLCILLEIGVFLLVAFLIGSSVAVRTLIVNPLGSYNRSIEQDKTVPVIGAAELQTLAVTYNRIFEENLETQRLIRHEAEHDALTDLLNRSSFDKALALYSQGSMNFALILVDVDRFKSVNDTYGHAVGDEILRRVAKRLKESFRSTDYVFRIGGDEFAVLMMDVSEALRHTVEEKLASLKKGLVCPEEGLPEITLSIGVAFSDRKDPGESIFKDGDQALYYVKKHGKDGNCFYEENM